MSKVTEEIVMSKLSTVLDPEIDVNIVDLGLIYNVEISDDDKAHVIMTLTTPGCPMANMLAQSAEKAVMSIEGLKDVLIEVTFDPPWTPNMMSEDAKERLGIS